MPGDYDRRPRSRSRDRYRDGEDSYYRGRDYRSHLGRDGYYDSRRDRDNGREYPSDRDRYDRRDLDRDRCDRDRREQDRDRYERRDQGRDRKYDRERRSRSPQNHGGKSETEEWVYNIEQEEEPEEPLTEEEAEMKKALGFSSFGTTKGKHVIGNNVYVASVVKSRKYRQYMNRRGGFNRPLDHVT